VSISTSSQNDGSQLTISVTGTLGNDVHREFRDAYEKNQSESYVVDLGHSDNIDSSGLGMLLLLRDFAGGDDANITIINCSETILEIFKVTCFFRLFTIPDYA